MNITSADYFTFNVNYSLLLLGQTGSGKSFLVERLIASRLAALDPKKIQFAIFDLKQCFSSSLDIKPEYLLFDIERNGDEKTFQRLEDLAQLCTERVLSHSTQPQVFIYIEENDLARMDQERFDKAILTINRDARRTNMKLIYSTSSPSGSSVSEGLRDSFELILAGPLLMTDHDVLRLPYTAHLKPLSFVVTENRS
ncbi:MAG: hypothetical protein JWN28_271 [Candidatus Saccharibacteria bacterium]|nr:hypothetical protein [Candidatus Saccharibacteria bacterium]